MKTGLRIPRLEDILVGPTQPYKYYETQFKLPFCIIAAYAMLSQSIQTQNLTKNSRAVQLLIAKLRDGSIPHDTDPKRIWESESIFRVPNLQNFSTCLNNL